MKKNIFIIGIILLLGGVESAYSMNQVKDWVNKVKPGTFETDDAAAGGDEAKKGPRNFTEAEMKVLIALKQREEALRKKEEIYEKKAKELKGLAQQIEQKLDQMRRLRADFEKKRSSRQKMDEKNINRMVKYYETMDPESTAVFFNTMSRLTASHILMRMNPRKASAVMQLLDPKVAVEITEQVSGFNEAQKELAK